MLTDEGFQVWCLQNKIPAQTKAYIEGILSQRLSLLGTLHEGRVSRLHFLERSGIVISGATLVGKNTLLLQPGNIFHSNGRKMALTLFVVSS